MVSDLNKRGQEALFRATIWAFVGSLYGIMFTFFFSMSQYWSFPLNPLLVAGTLAGTIAATIYSSMSLAVIVAPLSSVISLFYVVANGNHIQLLSLAVITAIAGAIAGSIYGLKAKKSRVFRADAKTLTGICSGATVSVLFIIISYGLPELPLGITVSILCLLTGALYVTLVPEFVKRFDWLLPPVADGALVGAGTAFFVAILFFVMISGVTPEVAGTLQLLTEQIRNTLPQTAFGGMIGGGIAGFVSGFMLRKWQDI